MRSLRSVVLLALAIAPVLLADVTIRYQQEFKTGAALPGATGKAMMPVQLSSIRIKGAKGYTDAGGFTMIMDFAKQELTLLDTANRKYATIAASQYSGKMAGLMSDMQDAFASIKTKVESKKTGRTEVIQGVQAEEREITSSTEMPVSVPGQSSSAMKIVVQIWAAKPEEALRVPAFRELSGFQAWQKYFLDPRDMFGKGGMGTLLDEISKDQSVILRMHMSLYMPFGADANAPFMQVNQEVVELSTAAVDESLFEIPKEYSSAPFEEVFHSVTHPGAGGSAAAHPVPDKGGAQAYVPMLSPVRRTEPAYPDAARAQEVQGIVRLLVTVNPQGNVAQAEALGGPEMLRQPAIDAVKQWKFRPVIRDGQPVLAYTDASVFFHDEKSARRGVAPDVTGEMEATNRRSDLKKAFPRSPEQELADLEQDASGDNPARRFHALDKLAEAALGAGANEKAAAYASELLKTARQDAGECVCGDAIHDGNMILGLVALRQGDVPKATQHLLEAGKTPGSPVLNSFGPNMRLAKELLQKGETGAVLQYLSLCGSFWTMGRERLDKWSETIRTGGTPNFGLNLR